MFQAILPFWGIIDQIYFQFNRLQFIDKDGGNVFRVRPICYRGETLILKDGTEIHSGDLLLKIHLYNYALMKEMVGMRSEIRRALFVYQMVENSMPGLAKYLHLHPRSEEIKGVIGITLLNRGVRHLGFDSIPIANDYYRRWKKSYMVPMYYICHGFHKGNSNKKLDPKILVMSKNRLFESYLNP
ncbi:YkoP family protein [Ammoniphilus resinae]|uniref:YkoP-like domain-containing protein n=1 Tax=Ammoniphilus resinae TaxID=861532 RepID=A0ABS4GTF1_9BACL|nr:hypothetical protein [Ammoniphilus resinae]MBP1933558.1 hypothetical protein [Ammoniphilus resinae]